MLSSKLFPLAKKASAEEARDKAGHTKIQWDRFYYITKDEARRLIKTDITWTWPRVPANVKTQMIERVNALLRNEKIPEVDEDILAWRMSIALRDCRHNLSNKARMEECGTERGSTRSSSAGTATT